MRRHYAFKSGWKITVHENCRIYSQCTPLIKLQLKSWDSSVKVSSLSKAFVHHAILRVPLKTSSVEPLLPIDSEVTEQSGWDERIRIYNNASSTTVKHAARGSMQTESRCWWCGTRYSTDSMQQATYLTPKGNDYVNGINNSNTNLKTNFSLFNYNIHRE